MSEIRTIDRFALEELDRRVPVVGQQDVVAFAPQHDRQQFAHRQLIVDDENRGPHGLVAATGAASVSVAFMW